MHKVEFSTCAGSVEERRRQWCAMVGSGGVELDDDGIEATMRGGDIGVTRICAVELGGHRTTSEPARTSRAVSPLVKLVFQEEGECLFEQGGRAVTLHAGEWCAYDKSQPYCIRNTGFSRQTAIVLPFAAIDHSRGLDHFLLASYASTRGADQVLHATLVAGVSQVGSLSEVSAHLLGQALLKLVELTVLARCAAGCPISDREARRAEILEYVDRHLDDPTLDVEAISRAFSCSKRYLHKLFIDHGTTIARVIWNRRLDRCHAQLCDPGTTRRTITDIAFACGFSDSHHFSRLFKDRFGVAPRDFRKSCAH